MAILIVEDEAFVAWHLSDMLEDSGFEVAGIAGSVNEGMRMLDGCAITAAILDVNLGSDTVWPVARVLRDGHIPFLFATADLQHPELAAEFSDKIKLSKPVSKSDLLLSLSRILGSDKVEP